jgi:hypothetical protein
MVSILEAYDWRRVHAELTKELSSLCSPLRITLIRTCLRRRLKAIRRAFNEQAR